MTYFGETPTTDGDYTVVRFLQSGDFIAPGNVATADCLIVAGGGGGSAGGGGAGGVLQLTEVALSGTMAAVVGGGGAGVVERGGAANGGTGVPSSFAGSTAHGGGGGGADGSGYNNNGADGGSGGGAGASGTVAVTGGAATPSGEGNAGGGTTYCSAPYPAGGGGGAGGAGAAGDASHGGYGGAGIEWNGIEVGGGGGGCAVTGGAGTNGTASHGGGASGIGGATTGTAGAANTGGGGGGGGYPGGSGGAGGSGVVVIRYLTPRVTGGTVTLDGDYTVHTFTEDGTLTCNETIEDCDCLIVAGGGAGGTWCGGGGGAGGVRTLSEVELSGALDVTIGAGAAAGTANGSGADGEDSTLGEWTQPSATNEVPTMTGATTPSGVASASSQYSGTYVAWLAFDHAAGTSGDYSSWVSQSGIPSGWLQYQFTAAKTIEQYHIRARYSTDGAGNAPRDWTLQGSSDGASWTTLDTRTDETFAIGQTRSFDVASPGSYAYYRLDVTENNGSSYVGIDELELCTVVAEEGYGAYGGGGGAGYQGAPGAGGSGGGGYGGSTTSNAGGAGTDGQGYAGGSKSNGSNNAPGGGGAGEVGGGTTVDYGGYGGAGIEWNGIEVGGGGAGWGFHRFETAAAGGGGLPSTGDHEADNAHDGTGRQATAGAANTGGGGGGGWYGPYSYYGAAGGSGIVVVRYLTAGEGTQVRADGEAEWNLGFTAARAAAAAAWDLRGLVLSDDLTTWRMGRTRFEVGARTEWAWARKWEGALTRAPGAASWSILPNESLVRSARAAAWAILALAGGEADTAWALTAEWRARAAGATSWVLRGRVGAHGETSWDQSWWTEPWDPENPDDPRRPVDIRTVCWLNGVDLNDGVTTFLMPGAELGDDAIDYDLLRHYDGSLVQHDVRTGVSEMRLPVKIVGAAAAQVDAKVDEIRAAAVAGGSLFYQEGGPSAGAARTYSLMASSAAAEKRDWLRRHKNMALYEVRLVRYGAMV